MASTLGRTLAAAVTMGAAVLLFFMVMPPLHPAITILGGGLIGLATYVAVGFLLGVQELWLMPRLVGR
jgi:hypothetical protein